MGAGPRGPHLDRGLAADSPEELRSMRDLIVLSDFHLGRGKNLDTGRYWSLEAFFYDKDFLSFVNWLCGDTYPASPDQAGLKPQLIFNGDTFDLLRVEPEEDSRGEGRTPAFLTPASASRILDQILLGHPTFVEALARALMGGVPVLFLPGNHDIELQWLPVQAVLRRAVAAEVVRLGGPGQELVDEAMQFRPWFYHEHGRVWIEHGCQYDPENAFRWYLRGQLSELAADDTELDQPLGNFFQRYLYNGFGPITFMVPSSRANFRYGRWLLLNNPALLLSAATSQLPFAWRWLRRLTLKKLLPPSALPAVHAAELESLAEQSGLGRRLLDIEALKDLRGDVVAAVESIARNLLRTMGISMLAALLLIALWFFAFDVIQHADLGSASKTLWFVALNFFFFSTLTVGGTLLLLRDNPTTAGQPMPNAAERIARLLEVPLVTFGHTHDESVQRLALPSHRGWYFNTGTWIAVFTHDVLLPRERVQYTFLRICGTQAELLHWHPARQRAEEVVLLDE